MLSCILSRSFTDQNGLNLADWQAIRFLIPDAYQTDVLMADGTVDAVATAEAKEKQASKTNKVGERETTADDDDDASIKTSFLSGGGETV